jgi:hypothetical protein
VGEQFEPQILESFDLVTQEIYRDLPAIIHTENLHQDQNLNSQTGFVGSCSLWIEQQELKPPCRTEEEKLMTGATGWELETATAKKNRKAEWAQRETDRRMEKSGRESLSLPAHEDSVTGDND